MSRRARRAPIAWRGLHGIVLLDKPLGLSSHQALQRARRRLRAAKGGHAGSLDPLASGMLPLCLGEASRLSAELLGQSKHYTTRLRLGQRSSTGDAEGEIIETRPVPPLDPAGVDAVLAGFRGRIRQRPPAYSAVHVAGQRAYQRARRGEALELPEREVTILRLECLGIGPDWLDLAVECGSGTYIRALGEDIGTALGCGAHLASLRRDWVAPFRDQAMLALDELEAWSEADSGPWLLPLAAAIPDWPKVELRERRLIALLGQGRSIPSGAAPPGRAAALDGAGRLLALGEVDAAGRFQPRRVFPASGIGPALA